MYMDPVDEEALDNYWRRLEELVDELGQNPDDPDILRQIDFVNDRMNAIWEKYKGGSKTIGRKKLKRILVLVIGSVLLVLVIKNHQMINQIFFESITILTGAINSANSQVIFTPSASPTSISTIVSAYQFPIGATPLAVATNAPPLAIDFLIESIEVGDDTIRFDIVIKRRIEAPLSWTSDESRKKNIYLETVSKRYGLVEMGGVFTQDTVLQFGQSYSGWLVFEKPDKNKFVFHYPDIKLVQIDAQK